MTHSPQLSPSFAPTRWTLVLRARGESEEARKALGELCECYWTPVFRFVRCQGHHEDTARELTQEFFARLLKRANLEAADPERGHFRSYLLGAVKHFLADCRDHEQRLKRGGGNVPTPLENPDDTSTSAALRVPDPTALPSDTLFDHAWAIEVMNRALLALEREFADSGKAHHFQTLKPWLQGDSSALSLSQESAAARLNLSEGAVKVAIHRLRKRFRELVRSELVQTVRTPNEVDGELRYLVEVLSRT